MDPTDAVLFKAAREAWGTQEKLSEQLGYERLSSGVRQISRWESGGGIRDHARYQRACEIIGIADSEPVLRAVGRQIDQAYARLEVRLDRILAAIGDGNGDEDETATETATGEAEGKLRRGRDRRDESA